MLNRSSVPKVGLLLLIGLFTAACSAADATTPTTVAAGTTAAETFQVRMATLRESASSAELDAEEMTAMRTLLDGSVANVPALAAFAADAGIEQASVGTRVVLRDGSNVRMISRVFEREPGTAAVQSRVTYVAFEHDAPLVYAERFTPGSDRVELFVAADGELNLIGAPTLADTMQPAALLADPTMESTDGTGVSVEAVNRTACSACRGAYGALRSAGCGWGAAALCAAAGVPTAGAGLALCGALVSAVCRFGLSQIAPLDPTLVCNFIGARVSRDRRWCESAPRTCSSTYFDAAETSCDRCIRFANCAATQTCRVGSGVLCAVIGGDDDELEGRLCRAGASEICRAVDRNAPDASRNACRQRGYCD